ncbi:hypothetical protein [Tenacibaculum ovolyticum]|uniref:hypothetical protein n=1 Tax=Tenacibaculum ovolyticum TaxID=104270 RepID=UPI0007ED934D|nr:hypothetical protein [Tenacibaculum ovolyticum]
MLKNISNLGAVLNKTAQKEINGGLGIPGCNLNYLWCPPGCVCHVDEVLCKLVQVCEGDAF